MLMLLRHFMAILLLPGMVTVVVPAWILSSYAARDSRWAGDGALVWLARAAGIDLVVGGIALFIWCVSLFAQVGRGTLAPWDPTQQVVAVGPYRWTRNPMISAVATILTGEALFWGSWRLALWAGIFVAINHAYFILVEEPGLRLRFGESYQAYAARVPRWLPRLRRGRE